MSESKSKDDMPLEQRRRDAREHGYTLDDNLDDDPIVNRPVAIGNRSTAEPINSATSP